MPLAISNCCKAKIIVGKNVDTKESVELCTNCWKQCREDSGKLNFGDPDKGHVSLINDLKGLYNEAMNLNFHDFLSEKYTTPKRTLREKLLSVIHNIESGKYDN